MNNRDKVLNYLKHKELTVRTATLDLDLNGGTFTKIISDLIKEGVDIRKEYVSRENKEGQKKYFMVYYLGEGNE